MNTTAFFILVLYVYANLQRLWLRLWCLTPFSTIFQLYRGDTNFQLNKYW
jgi:hypothetical protein